MIELGQMKNKKTIKKPVNGIEQLRKVKEETINRWEKSGLLNGLVGNPDVNMAKMFECQLSYIINESGTTTQFSDVVLPVTRKTLDKIENNKKIK
jgi:hypothetical protein